MGLPRSLASAWLGLLKTSKAPSGTGTCFILKDRALGFGTLMECETDLRDTRGCTALLLGLLLSPASRLAFSALQ